MRHTIRRAAVAAVLAATPLLLLPATSADAATTTGVCNLPTVVSRSNVLSSTGAVIGTAEMRRATVKVFLGHSYYRYCARLYLATPPAGPTIGTATIKYYAKPGAAAQDFSTTGPITYVAPGTPAYATAGISSPTIDVKQGTVGYAVSLHRAS